MKRTNLPLPDAINRSVTKEFTQVPNEVVRSPEMSAKAVKILCVLLSNKEGWRSYLKTIQSMMKEGENAIDNGIRELQKFGYLKKIRIRDKQTKLVISSIWMYTDMPNQFKSINDYTGILEKHNMEIMPCDWNEEKTDSDFHHDENHDDGTHCNGNQGLRILNKNTNDNNTNDLVDDGKITPSQFGDFWKLYPKKDGKGAAKKAWERVCSKKPKDRPTWDTIEVALQKQKKTERWQNKRFIPRATTWLNQYRWLDDPAEMVSYGNSTKQSKQTQQNSNPEDILTQYVGHNGNCPNLFIDRCFNRAKELIGALNNGDLSALAENMGELYQRVEKKQSSQEINDTYSYDPMSIITYYLNWIEDNDWIRDKNPSLFCHSGKLFSKFLKDEARHNFDRDPITGKMA